MPATGLHWITEPLDTAAGGKALGLRRLSQWGLRVPPAFVLVHPQGSELPADLPEYYRQLGGGKVAVRSSAVGEDGADSSFAGLYETLLDVEGNTALHKAIEACMDSLHSARAAAYQDSNAVDASHMSVVVQRMVDASLAGVLFTVDPVSGRHDRLVIDAVRGLGESLVSGEETPDHYEFNLDGELVLSQLTDEEALLTPEQCEQLVTQARRAVESAGEPLDMEWAFDQQGELYWLQARPVTTVGSDLNELDTPVRPDDVLTRCNVGEMMPGASCPLTFSTTGRAIEHGMQHMHVSYAGRPGVTDEWTQLAMSHGKLFLNLSGSLTSAATVLGVDAKSMGHSVCGRIVDELEEPQKRSLPVRLLGTWRLLRYLQRADKVIAAFTIRAERFRLPVQGDSATLAKALDEAQDFFYEAFCVHLQSSTTSGFASNLLQAMVSGGQESTPEEEAEAARLLAGASDVESALLVEQLDDIVSSIINHADARQFAEAPDAGAAQAWLSAQADLAKAFDDFLQRHGHRSYRELCVREQAWRDDPLALIASLQSSVGARLAGAGPRPKPDAIDTSSLGLALRWILPKAHRAIRRREATKSQLVGITHTLKSCYRALGEQLLKEQRLSDADQVFFFTHQELMGFVLGADTQNDEHWQQRTRQRRLALTFQDRLDFDEICVGQPVPIEHHFVPLEGDDRLVGRPVSRGVVEAVARVALNVEEAAALEPGEILVAPITDVGWTPYFGMIAGLITDVGSAVSHGAVIAREYGLPAIVNTRTATRAIRTGDRVRLDADSGFVTILQP